MQLIFILAIAFISIAWACAPVQNTEHVEAEENDGERKRRSLDEIIITLVTNRKFNQKTKKQNQSHVRKILNNFQKKEGFYIDYSEIQEVVKNETGKFAIEYKMLEECEQVKHFVRGAKSTSREIAYILLSCGNQPLEVL